MLDDEKLREIMAMVLEVPIEDVSHESNMDNIENWDSLRHMNLILALEDEFEITIPDEEAANITSFSLIKLVVNEQL